MILLFQLLALACVWVTLFSLWYASLLNPWHHIFDFSVSLCCTIRPLGMAVSRPAMSSHPVSWTPEITSCTAHVLLQQKGMGPSVRAQVRGTFLYETLKLSNGDICSLCGICQCNTYISILSMSDGSKNKIY